MRSDDLIYNYMAMFYAARQYCRDKELMGDVDYHIDAALKKYGLLSREKRKQRFRIDFDTNTLEWIKEQRNNKVTFRELSEKLQVSQFTIARRLQEHEAKNVCVR